MRLLTIQDQSPADSNPNGINLALGSTADTIYLESRQGGNTGSGTVSSPLLPPGRWTQCVALALLPPPPLAPPLNRSRAHLFPHDASFNAILKNIIK